MREDPPDQAWPYHTDRAGKDSPAEMTIPDGLRCSFLLNGVLSAVGRHVQRALEPFRP